MANLLLDIWRRRTGRTSACQYLYQSSHPGRLADEQNMLSAAISLYLQSERTSVIENISSHFIILPMLMHVREKLTLQFASSIAFTHAADSMVHDLTVSVLPSLYNLVIDASYVRLNFPASY